MAEHNPWRLVADVSDRIGELMTEIPGWDGYDFRAETQSDLRRAAALLRQAIPLLESVLEREGCRPFAEP